MRWTSRGDFSIVNGEGSIESRGIRFVNHSNNAKIKQCFLFSLRSGGFYFKFISSILIKNLDHSYFLNLDNLERNYTYISPIFDSITDKNILSRLHVCENIDPTFVEIENEIIEIINQHSLVPYNSLCQNNLFSNQQFYEYLEPSDELKKIGYKLDEPNKEWICPISLQLINEPVSLNGYKGFYEKKFIVSWVAKNKTDPISHTRVELDEIKDDIETRKHIIDFLNSQFKKKRLFENKLKNSKKTFNFSDFIRNNSQNIINFSFIIFTLKMAYEMIANDSFKLKNKY